MIIAMAGIYVRTVTAVCADRASQDSNAVCTIPRSAKALAAQLFGSQLHLLMHVSVALTKKKTLTGLG